MNPNRATSLVFQKQRQMKTKSLMCPKVPPLVFGIDIDNINQPWPSKVRHTKGDNCCSESLDQSTALTRSLHYSNFYCFIHFWCVQNLRSIHPDDGTKARHHVGGVILNQRHHPNRLKWAHWVQHIDLCYFRELNSVTNFYRYWFQWMVYTIYT